MRGDKTERNKIKSGKTKTKMKRTWTLKSPQIKINNLIKSIVIGSSFSGYHLNGKATTGPPQCIKHTYCL